MWASGRKWGRQRERKNWAGSPGLYPRTPRLWPRPKSRVGHPGTPYILLFEYGLWFSVLIIYCYIEINQNLLVYNSKCLSYSEEGEAERRVFLIFTWQVSVSWWLLAKDFSSTPCGEYPHNVTAGFHQRQWRHVGGPMQGCEFQGSGSVGDPPGGWLPHLTLLFKLLQFIESRV